VSFVTLQYLTKPIKVCDLCGTMKIVKPSKMNRGEKNYCSKQCQSKALIGKSRPKEVGLKISKANMGRIIKPESIKKMIATRKTRQLDNIIDWQDPFQVKEWKHEWYLQNNNKPYYHHKESIPRSQLSDEELKEAREKDRNSYWKNYANRGEKYLKNREKKKTYSLNYHYEHREEKINYMREYGKNNPRSSRQYPLELQIIMNEVRVRDKNTCKWYGCGLTNRDAPIHVNHIFPKSEYPELMYEKRFMICYCLNHHVMFHYYRGDGYDKILQGYRKILELDELGGDV